MTSQVSSIDKNWQISEDGSYFYLTTILNFDINNFELFLNKTYEETIFINNEPIKIATKIEPLIQGDKLTVKIEKKVIKNYDINLDQTTDFGFTDNTLSQNISYLLKTMSINNQGLPLSFYIVDETKKQSYLEDRLNNPVDYFILQPRFKSGLGYTFAFQNKSFKNLQASNNLEELSLYLFPYQALKEMKFVRKDFDKLETIFSDNFEANKLNYFTYKVVFNKETMKQSNNLILSQSYSPGWVAFSNGKLLNHVLVNNWANGWKLVDSDQWLVNSEKKSIVTIIFWPQFLEFLGFGLMIVAFIFVIKYKHE